MPELCYLIDAHSLIFQVFHAIPAMTGPKGQPTNAVYGFTGDLLRLRRKQPAYLVCVFDPPGKTFRDTLYQEYKATRAPMPMDLTPQFPVISRMLEAMRVPVVCEPGFEADDAIATIARQAEARGADVHICTGDKDLRQLISDQVKIYNLRKDQILDRNGLQAEWGIAPEQVIDLLALMGDSVDNVPGVPGVGIKTAQKLLQEHGSIDQLLTNLDQVKAAKLRDNLRAHTEALEMGRKLVRLEEHMPLDCTWDAWRLQPMNLPNLLALFEECGFHRYATEVRQEAARERPAPSVNGELFPEAEQRALLEAAWEADYELVDTPAKFAAFLKRLSHQKRFVFNIETTVSSLLDAEIVGYAFSWEPGKAYYVAVRRLQGQPALDAPETLRQLKPILEWPQVEKINHNIKDEIIALRRAGIKLAGIAGDAMVASYLLNSGDRNHNLGELSLRELGHTPMADSEPAGKGKNLPGMEELDTSRLARRAGEEADIAWRLSAKLEPRLQERGLDALYRNLEVPLIEVLAEMEHSGVKVDVPLLRRLSGEFAEQLDRLEAEIHAKAGRRFNIGSPKQLREVLFDELKLPAARKTSITGEASTGQDVLEDLAATGHELPRLIIEHRQLAKLKGTYLDALPDLVNPRTGRVHASFNQTVAATGRLSSSDPNLQNIPVRTEQGRQIRQAFIPGAPGWLLVTADYSQIELRVLAHFSNDAELKQAFQEDRDIHASVAARIYGVPEAEVNREQRRNAKTINFGVLYGLSAFGLGKRLGLERADAAAFIDAYFGRYPGVAEFQKKLLDEARKNGYVRTILGRRRAFEGGGIREHSSYRQRNQAEREALNTVIQGSAADLIKQAMLNIQRRLDRETRAARMLLQIHDELVFEAPLDERDALAALITDEMTSALELDVPLKVDIATGPNWLDVEPLETQVCEFGVMS